MEEKNLGGRPALFKNPEDLKKAIQDYIDKPNHTPTISGLAYHLGFESRQSFYDYAERDEFSYIIKRSRLFMESHYEERLQGNNPTGAIFWLKNAGWIDKQEVESRNINYNTELTKDEIKNISDALDSEV